MHKSRLKFKNIILILFEIFLSYKYKITKKKYFQYTLRLFNFICLKTLECSLELKIYSLVIS